MVADRLVQVDVNGQASAWRKVFLAFVLVYASMNGLMLLAVVGAFHNPQTAGVFLLARTAPSFFMGWVTGFAVDWHKTVLLGWCVAVLAAVTFFVPPSLGMLLAGVVLAWAEVSLSSLLSERRRFNPQRTAVTVGYGYDVAKLLSVGFAYILGVVAGGRWVLAVVAVAGVFLLRKAYRERVKKGKKGGFTWKTQVVVVSLSATVASLGINNILWLQGRHNATFTLFLFAGLGFAVGAIAGNTTVLVSRGRIVGYPLAIVGAVAMVGVCVFLAVGGNVDGGWALVGVWGVFGWGCAVLWQSARTVLFSVHPSGRDVALFSTTSRVGVAVGGVALSRSIPYDNWVVIASGVATVSVLLGGLAWQSREVEALWTVVCEKALRELSDEFGEDYAKRTVTWMRVLYQQFPVEWGRGRVVFLTPETVIKIPITGEGMLANLSEVNMSECYRSGDSRAIPVARGRWEKSATGVEYVRAERVEPVRTRGETLPAWVDFVDCGQVGYTSDGTLVAYDL